MKPSRYGIALCAAFASLAACGYEIPLGEGTDVGATDFYIVPSGTGRIAFKYASIPIFSLEDNTGKYIGANGAAVAEKSDDGVVVLKHRDFMNAGPATLDFENGHLKSFRRNGDEAQKAKDLELLSAHPKKQPTLAQLWRVKTDEQKEKAKAQWWRGDSRLRLGYFNPNAAGTLFAEIAALFSVLALILRRPCYRILFATATIPMLYALCLTGSRGSFVAWIAGMSIAAFCFLWGKTLRPKTIGLVIIALFAAACGLVAIGNATSGRFGADLLAIDAGNVQRLRAWRAAPEMMAAAPGGWGEEPGRAYCDWFQPTDDTHRLYYLVNSHLTWLVQYGRLFRVAYFASWIFLFLCLFASLRRQFSRAALCVCVAFAVALWFSTVGIFSTLWILPGACALLSIGDMAWACIRNGGAFRLVRLTTIAAVTALLAGYAISFVLESIGRSQAESRDIPVSYDGKVVRIGRGEATAAILNDATVLAGGAIGCLGHELRDWMTGNNDLGAILVADDAADLPQRIDCLIAAGKGGAKYWIYREKHLSDGEYCHANRTIFISPPFSPSDITYTFMQMTDTRLFIGEFAAQLSLAYNNERPWVTIVPGAELYIPGWPALTLYGADDKGGAK